jgi:hypothetical protein
MRSRDQARKQDSSAQRDAVPCLSALLRLRSRPVVANARPIGACPWLSAGSWKRWASRLPMTPPRSPHRYGERRCIWLVSSRVAPWWPHRETCPSPHQLVSAGGMTSAPLNWISHQLTEAGVSSASQLRVPTENGIHPIHTVVIVWPPGINWVGASSGSTNVHYHAERR